MKKNCAINIQQIFTILKSQQFFLSELSQMVKTLQKQHNLLTQYLKQIDQLIKECDKKNVKESKEPK